MRHLFFLALFFSCANIRHVQRTELELGSFDELLYSNLETNPYDQAEIEDGLLAYKYAVVFQNSSSEKTYSLQLDRSRLKVNGEVSSVACQDAVKGKAKILLIRPNDVVKVVCQLEISPSESNLVLDKDSTAQLVLQVEGESLSFPFKTKIEDFE